VRPFQRGDGSCTPPSSHVEGGTLDNPNCLLAVGRSFHPAALSSSSLKVTASPAFLFSYIFALISFSGCFSTTSPGRSRSISMSDDKNIWVAAADGDLGRIQVRPRHLDMHPLISHRSSSNTRARPSPSSVVTQSEPHTSNLSKCAGFLHMHPHACCGIVCTARRLGLSRPTR